VAFQHTIVFQYGFNISSLGYADGAIVSVADYLHVEDPMGFAEVRYGKSV
jgi:hypothetical protein